ncbi:hypothetical protein K488DRAFT_70529 [Vararia minispora EC-137]|uniref:Uncharacterized protein n=1 Tax=Vararia minispora EC-137 TaxID=1314806 RepID=A0ACB8QL71_9AGAM|nr:hypothetical protein K488DRAFT_70529 [Vararia minispora EC-137]
MDDLQTIALHALHDPGYLATPIETLLYSLKDQNISSLDLSQAYATIFTRLRTVNIESLSCAYTPSALQVLKASAYDVIKIIRRDVSHIGRNSSYHSERCGSLQEKTDRMNAVVLSDHALRLLAQLVHHPALRSIVFDSSLGDLFDELLTIVSDDTVFTGSYRLLSLATLSLSGLAIDIPAPTLERRSDDIIAFLRSVFENQLFLSHNADALHDGLRMLSCLLKLRASRVLTTCAALLPLILPLLLSPFPSLRHCAGLTLGSYAAAIAHSVPRPPNNVISILSKHTKDFLKPQARRFFQHEADVHTLGHIFDSCISLKSHAPGDCASWTLSVASSLIVMLGRRFLFLPDVMRLLWNPVRSLRKLEPHRSRLPSLEEHVSRTMIWTFGELREWQQREGRDVRAPEGKGQQAIAQCALSTIRSRMDTSLFFALTASILGTMSGGQSKESDIQWGVETVLSVVRDMLSHRRLEVSNDGRALLAQLLAGIGNPSATDLVSWKPSLLLCRDVFNGAGTADCDVDLPKITLSAVRTLDESTISEHWDELAEIWEISIRRHLSEGTVAELDADAKTWQALLLSKAQLTQGHTHLTSQDPVVELVVSKIANHLKGEEDPVAQAQRLQLIRSLWSVCKNVFDCTWLASAASKILTSVMNCFSNIHRLEVQGNQADLCADLLLHGLPNSLDVAFKGSLEVEAMRWFWHAMASAWAVSHLQLSYADAVAHLLLPFQYAAASSWGWHYLTRIFSGSWRMNDDEFEVWMQLLSWANQAAPGNVVLEAIMSGLPDNHMDLQDVDQTSPGLLETANSALLRAYADGNINGLVIISCLRQILRDKELPDYRCLVILHDGLEVWIKDEEEVTTVNDYNAEVMGLYQAILDSLKRIPITFSGIIDLTPLLAAGFRRIPPPALGPQLFKTFFADVHLQLGISAGEYPRELHTCISSAFRFFGDEPPEGVETQIEELPSPAAWSASCPPAGKPVSTVESSYGEWLRDSIFPSGRASDLREQPRPPERPVNLLPQSDHHIPSPKRRIVDLSQSDMSTHRLAPFVAKSPREDSGGYLCPSPPRVLPIRRALPRYNLPGKIKQSSIHPVPFHKRMEATSPSTNRARSKREVMAYVELPEHRQPPRRRVRLAAESDAKSTSMFRSLPKPAIAESEDYDNWEAAQSTPVTQHILRKLDKEQIVPETPDDGTPARIPQHPHVPSS